MEITINGQLASLKKNTSFEYISENPLFTGSDSYTLTITFPLKDCPQNIQIFGHLHRQDVVKNKVVFNCEIRDKDFFKSGTIVVTQISEVEVKTQFLEGRSEQNFDDTFDDIYLNELHLGYPDTEERNPSTHDTNYHWQSGYPTRFWVALPWVNNTSGNMQNAVQKDELGEFMECIVNYPSNDVGKQMLLEKVSKLNAKLVIYAINNLNIQSYSKNIIIKGVLEIIKDSPKY